MNEFLYFLTIVEEGSITKAAQRLYISQPGLSKYLKNLETKLGYKLINRNTRPLTLTTEGEIYLDFINDSIYRYAEMKNDLSNTSKNIKGTINFGLTVWRSSVLMPLIFPSFKKKYPNIDINLFEGSHQRIISLLKKGEIELALIHRPNNYRDLNYINLFKEDIVFITNINNSILTQLEIRNSKMNYISIDEFKLFQEENFIMLKQGQNIRKTVDTFTELTGTSFKVGFETSNIITAINLVNQGFGVSFAPESAIENFDLYSNLVFFKITDSNLQWLVSFAYLESLNISNAGKTFIDYTKDLIKNN